jgi:hypothetical protein
VSDKISGESALDDAGFDACGFDGCGVESCGFGDGALAVGTSIAGPAVEAPSAKTGCGSRCQIQSSVVAESASETTTRCPCPEWSTAAAARGAEACSPFSAEGRRDFRDVDFACGPAACGAAETCGPSTRYDGAPRPNITSPCSETRGSAAVSAEAKRIERRAV